ncbi:MAG TPA: hypothetical protein GX396_00915 [Tissierellia bacterium]|jgi:hypothetical protein|nr:hypothetical protein [Tissierellia bacterium]
MKNIYPNQFNFYMRPYRVNKCNDLFSFKSVYPAYNAYMMRNSGNTGFIRINVIDEVTRAPIESSSITIYVTDGMQRDIPIMHIFTTISPVTVELPIASDLGTQIVGPMYDFSTYNLRVDASGYFANVVYNIRIFPGTTVDFEIAMLPVSEIQREPVIEERLDIPPHPRDVLTP